MKGLKITYWITTALIALMMLFSAYSYVANPQLAAGFHHLGFPDYFRIELAVFKAIGAIILILPIIKGWVKDWGYAGFFITFISAFIAHTCSGDPMSHRMPPIISLIVLLVSFFIYRRLNNKIAVTA